MINLHLCERTNNWKERSKFEEPDESVSPWQTVFRFELKVLVFRSKDLMRNTHPYEKQIEFCSQLIVTNSAHPLSTVHSASSLINMHCSMQRTSNN